MIDRVVFDVVIVCLLLAAAVYGAILSGRLQKLKEAQQELCARIVQFDEASRRATANLAKMEKLGAGSVEEVSRQCGRAERLATDLSIMINAGDRVADRIEQALHDVRKTGARENRSAA